MLNWILEIPLMAIPIFFGILFFIMFFCGQVIGALISCALMFLSLYQLEKMNDWYLWKSNIGSAFCHIKDFEGDTCKNFVKYSLQKEKDKEKSEEQLREKENAKKEKQKQKEEEEQKRYQKQRENLEKIIKENAQ